MRKFLCILILFPFQNGIAQYTEEIHAKIDDGGHYVQTEITIEEKSLKKTECLDKTVLGGRICWCYENDVLVKSFEEDSIGKVKLKRIFYQDGRIRKEIKYGSPGDSCQTICNMDKSRTESCYSKGHTILDSHYDEKGKLVYQTNYIKQDTIFTGFYPNGQKMLEFYSRNGKVISKKYWNEKGISLKPGKDVLPDNEFIFVSSPEELPEFPGGESEFKKWFLKNATYPEMCRENSIVGKMYVSLTISRDGSLKNIKIFTSPHDFFTREVKRVFNLMPKWRPAQLDGRRIDYTLHYSINFHLI